MSKHKEDKRSVLYANENVTNALFKNIFKSVRRKDHTFLSFLSQTENAKKKKKTKKKKKKAERKIKKGKKNSFKFNHSNQALLILEFLLDLL